jgi:hypothetical protein
MTTEITKQYKGIPFGKMSPTTGSKGRKWTSSNYNPDTKPMSRADKRRILSRERKLVELRKRGRR